MWRRRGGAQHQAPDRPAPVLFRWSALAAAAIFGLAVLALGTPLLPAPARGLVSDIALVPLAGAGVITSGWAARRAAGRLRRAWTAMTVATALWTLGEVGWFVEHYLTTIEHDPSFGDAFSLAAVVPAAVALLSFPKAGRNFRDRLVNLLSAVVSASAVLFIGRTAVLVALPAPASGSALARLVYNAYPVSDIALSGLILVALLRARHRARAPLVVLATGLGTYTVADCAYALLSASGHYAAGDALDLGWVAGYLLIALAPLAPPERAVPPRRNRSATVAALLVYLPVVTAAVVAASFPVPHPDPLVIVLSGVILIGFGVRQTLLAQDLAAVGRQRDEQLAALRETSTQLRRQVLATQRITSSVADGILVLDPGRRVLLANAPATQMLRRPAAELAGHLLDDLLVQPEDSLIQPDGEGAGAVVSAVVTGTVLVASGALLQTAGEPVPVEVTVGPMLEHGHVLGTVLVLRDVSARRAVERMKNEFISVVSHELRTPLTSIRGSLALLDAGMGGGLEPAGARMVSLALQSSVRLTRLIDDLLDVERMESGTLTLALQECDAARLVELAQREMRGLADSSRVELVIAGAAGRVRADPDRIVQTLTNLIGNAVKFSSPGDRVTISARPAGEVVQFCVADQGRGIPPDKLEAVFGRFEQVDSSDARQKGGTGLGLAISRQIVTRHGGRIWVSSELGRGSQFHFVLPVAEQATPVESAQPWRRAASEVEV